jgi:hypothetical protein
MALISRRTNDSTVHANSLPQAIYWDMRNKFLPGPVSLVLSALPIRLQWALGALRGLSTFNSDK